MRPFFMRFLKQDIFCARINMSKWFTWMAVYSIILALFAGYILWYDLVLKHD